MTTNLLFTLENLSLPVAPNIYDIHSYPDVFQTDHIHQKVHRNDYLVSKDAQILGVQYFLFL